MKTWRTDAKIAAVDNKTIELNQRVELLEKMADEAEQNRCELNLIVRGIDKSGCPKITIIEQLTRATSELIIPDDLRYAIKIDNKEGLSPVDSYKIAFYMKKKHDKILWNTSKFEWQQHLS